MILSVELEDDEAKQLETVYSGFGPMVSPDAMLQPMIRRMVRAIVRHAEMRHEVACSGAMRWPWSQEAGIVMELRVEFQ